MSSISDLVSVLLLRLWRIWKFILHIITGKSEIERICCSDLPQYKKTLLLEQAFRRSVQLNHTGLKKRLLDVGVDENLDELYTFLVASKNLSTGKAHFAQTQTVLKAALEQMQSVNKLLRKLDMARKSYDSGNSEHEALLMKLWHLLRPNVELTARKSTDWGELGFQGEDPATDFRGMGVLGLSNLVSFAQHWPSAANDIVSDSNAHSNWFGFAITGINLTSDIYVQLQKKTWNSYFYKHGASLESFTALYAMMFVKFNRLWTAKNPENVMSFGPIHSEFLANLHTLNKNNALEGLSKEKVQ